MSESPNGGPALSQGDGYLGPTPTLQREVEPDNCIKILLATDNHIGYAENDPVRGRDSINTFREILELALANDVDMLLLAGDLFHENRPSRTALYQTMAALREHTLGPRPISLEIVSDAGIGIGRNATWPGINYEDENLNVGLPIFSIHGNHDDPQGTGAEGALCALDLLSASGFINYFGRMELPGAAASDEDALGSGLQVKPVLLKKGDTKLALYGMGNIRDERFHFEMKNRRIQMFRPSEDPEDWFNIVLVHQNRVAHGPGRNVVDTAFGDEAHLVVWGHEHDCIERATPQEVTGRPYYIVQPGSSIATSLAKGESIPKHVSLIKVQNKEFEFKPIRLRSVRPFIYEDISLTHAQADDENLDLSSKVLVNKYLKSRVRDLIKRANDEWDELHRDDEEGSDDEGEDGARGKQERLLPLIRIRVDYSGGPDGLSNFEIGNPQRFGQDFIDKVANPRDIVQFHRKATTRAKKVEIDQPANFSDDEDGANAANDDGEALETRMEKLKVSTLVTKYLAAQNLGVLPEHAMQLAVEQFVDKDEKDAIKALITRCLKHSLSTIAASQFEPGRGGPELEDLGDEFQAAKKSVEDKLAKQDKRDKGEARAQEADDDDEDDEMLIHSDDAAVEVDSMAGSDASSSRSGRRTTTAAGKKKVGASSTARKSAAKAPAKKSTSAAASKGKKKSVFNAPDSDESEDSDDIEVMNVDDDDDDVGSTASRKKAPVKKAPAKKATASSSTAKKPATSRAAATKAKQKVKEVVMESEESADSSAAEEFEAPSKKRKR